MNEPYYETLFRLLPCILYKFWFNFVQFLAKGDR